MSDVIFGKDDSAINRARIERVLTLVGDILGFDPGYISLAPGVKPDDYTDGSPYGWYVKNVATSAGDLPVIQPVVWNSDTAVWDDLGQTFATVSFAEDLIESILSTFQSDHELIVSDVKDGGGAAVTANDPITNIISLTQAEYDAIVTPNTSTLYIIEDGV